MNIQQLFIRWYFNVFQTSDLYREMTKVSEDSKWHRERTVATHTDMVVTQYIANQENANNSIWTKPEINAAFACAFHDVGKPITRAPKYKVERGHYFSCSGHELASARLWEDYAVKNWNFLQTEFNLTPNDIYYIGWIIEHHRPWGIIKEHKINELIRTIQSTSNINCFTNVLLADNQGRIGDEQVINEAKTRDWIADFRNKYYKFIPIDNTNELDNRKLLLMLIGTSGSGKSTYTELDITKGRFKVHSMDDIRLRLYGDDYTEAFAASCKDKKFNGHVQRDYIDLLRQEKNIVVDNTNLSKKRRCFYLSEAKRRGYYTIAVLFPVDLQTVINRQTIRTDKCVSVESVKRQYSGLSYPNLGEFDKVIVNDCNLP